MQNKITGDIIELPRPDPLGRSFVLFNGKNVLNVTYADDPDRTITEDGRIFFGDDWAHWIIEQLRIGAWRNQA